jgi:hypothetical protein
MRNNVTIKLTERQLKEAGEEAFKYLTSYDIKPNNGNTEVSVNGKIGQSEFGKAVTTNKFASMRTSQGYNRYGAMGNTFTRGMMEMDDKNNDGIDDFYNNDEMDILSNGDETDNLEGISATLDSRTEMLIDQIKKFPPKKQAIVLNKILENIDLSGITYSWRKELIKKLSISGK